MAGRGISRRSFLQGAAAVGISSVLLHGDHELEGFARLTPDANALRFSNNPVNQGAASTWSGSSELVVTSRMCPPNGSRYQPVHGTISIFDSASGELVAGTEVAGAVEDDFRVRANFPGLDPRRKYRYDVRADELSDRTFSGNTHSPLVRPEGEQYVGRDRYVRLFFASCMEYSTGFWNAFSFAAKRNPDALFVIGDSIYADVEHRIFTGKRSRKDPIPKASDYEMFLMKYLACNDVDRIKILQKFPVYGVPDDHEMRNNIEGGVSSSHRIAAEGCKAYAAVYPSANGADARGFYRRVDFGEGSRVLILDTRRFRDESQGTMLGARQYSWLVDELGKAKTDNVNRLIIVTTVSFASGLERITDSWAGYKRERQHIIDEIARLDLKNVSFISGDLHTFYTGAVHLDPLNIKTDVVALEYEGGAISSKVGHTHNVNDHVLAYSKASNGIMEVEIDSETGSMNTRWWLYDAKKRDYVPEEGARFFSPPQSKYGSPSVSLQSIRPDLVANPGELELLR